MGRNNNKDSNGNVCSKQEGGVIDDFNKKEGREKKSSSVPVGAQKRVKKMGGIASCEGPMR